MFLVKNMICPFSKYMDIDYKTAKKKIDFYFSLADGLQHSTFIHLFNVRLNLDSLLFLTLNALGTRCDKHSQLIL